MLSKLSQLKLQLIFPLSISFLIIFSIMEGAMVLQVVH